MPAASPARWPCLALVPPIASGHLVGTAVGQRGRECPARCSERWSFPEMGAQASVLDDIWAVRLGFGRGGCFLGSRAFSMNSGQGPRELRSKCERPPPHESGRAALHLCKAPCRAESQVPVPFWVCQARSLPTPSSHLAHGGCWDRHPPRRPSCAVGMGPTSSASQQPRYPCSLTLARKRPCAPRASPPWRSAFARAGSTRSMRQRAQCARACMSAPACRQRRAPDPHVLP